MFEQSRSHRGPVIEANKVLGMHALVRRANDGRCMRRTVRPRGGTAIPFTPIALVSPGAARKDVSGATPTGGGRS